MAISHKPSTDSLLSGTPAGKTAASISSFVVCPIGWNFSGSPMVSQLGIYQIAYEQAKIAASRRWWGHSQNWSQN